MGEYNIETPIRNNKKVEAIQICLIDLLEPELP